MTNLKSCEILDELIKLGINKPTDALEYLQNYTDYLLQDKDDDLESE